MRISELFWTDMEWIGMSRLEKLKELEEELYKAMKKANSRSIAAISRQYRETIREIEEIEGAGDGENEIDKILNSV